MTLPKFLLTVVASVAGTVLLCGGLWLLLPGRGPERPAAPAVSLPAEVRGAPGEFVRVTAATTHPVSWDYPDAGLSVFPSEILKDDKTSVLSARTPGRYRLKAWVAVGGKAVGSNWCVVVIGDAPPDPPGPGPGPGPGPAPEPADPVWLPLKAAWAKEADPKKLEYARTLAALYREAGTTTVNEAGLKTVGDLYTKIKKAASTLVPDSALPNVRQALATEGDKLLPRNPALPLDAASRAAVGGYFLRVAPLLEALK